jgi:selenocysteine-specific elongation factor
VLLGDDPIAPGASAEVQLVLDRPIAAAVPDRFVIRDVSAQRTIGGGHFIDLRPPARRRRTPERQAQRVALALADPSAALATLLATWPFASDLAVFARDRALPAARTERLIAELGLVVLESNASRIAVSRERWRLFKRSLLQQLAAYHAQNPDLQGIGREKLRLSLQPRLPAPVFVTALHSIARDGEVVLDGSFVRLATHAARLTPKDEVGWSAIAPLLTGAERFRPPRVRDIAEMIGRPAAVKAGRADGLRGRAGA